MSPGCAVFQNEGAGRQPPKLASPFNAGLQLDHQFWIKRATAQVVGEVGHSMQNDEGERR